MRRPPLKALVVLGAIILAAFLARPNGQSRTQSHAKVRPSTQQRAIVFSGPHPADHAPTPSPISIQSVARRFATAYVRYLGGQMTHLMLPYATKMVQQLALDAGPVPPAARAGRLVLTSLGALQANVANQPQMTISAHDARHTFDAQITLQRLGGWRVTGLMPPDFDTVLGATQAAPAPSGPAGVRAAATAFVNSYLTYTYGHAPANQLQAISPRERAALAANPPSVPPGVQALHPRVQSLALRPARHGFTAFADVEDGQNSYWVICGLVEIDGRWLVTSLEPSG